MKKWIAMLLAMVLCLLAACGSQSGTAAETTAAETTTAKTTAAETTAAETTASSTADRTTFTVGFDAEYAPYGYMGDNGEYTGFDLEMAQAVCDIYGWELIKKPINWDSKDMELDSGSIDCIWNGFTVTGRENDYTWSEPYVDNSIVWVVKADSGIKSAADLAGKVIVTQSGSSAYTALTATEDNDDNLALAATFKELQSVADYNTAFANLDSGLVDAIAVDIGIAQYQLSSRADGSLVMLDAPLSTEQYAIGFKLGNTELRDQVQAGLDQLVENGTFLQLAEKYDLASMVCLGK
ncbi:MAG: amino acid ABC transporter substrate-binding protein [Oscillospiraceae bacterium]|nr:amino acid ABC transporter substrate-binding protein [Oscillospiraceae bacterium]